MITATYNYCNGNSWEWEPFKLCSIVGGISQGHLTHFFRNFEIGGIGQACLGGLVWPRMCAKVRRINQEYLWM